MKRLSQKLSSIFFRSAKYKLKSENINGHDVHFVDINNPKSLLLLHEAYKYIYEPAFPIDNERESIEFWLNEIRNEHNNLDIIIAIAIDQTNPKKIKPKAISVGNFFKKQSVGLMAYNAIAEEYRNQNISLAMVNARKEAFLELAKKQNTDLNGIFIECNDPEKVTLEEDSFDPALRIRIFNKFGAKTVPINYVQPPADKGLERCDLLKLLAYPHPKTMEYPKPSTIQGFIDGIYNSCAKFSGCHPSVNPDYIKIKEEISKLPNEPIHPNWEVTTIENTAKPK